jgi:hypothetical protein
MSEGWEYTLTSRNCHNVQVLSDSQAVATAVGILWSGTAISLSCSCSDLTN